MRTDLLSLLPGRARDRLGACLHGLLGVLIVTAAGTLPARADDFLPVKSAYKVATSVEPGRLVVRFDIAPDYYLYRDRLGFESASAGVRLGSASLPVGVDHEDEYFGRQVIYRDVAKVGIPVAFDGAARDFDVKVRLQGCADAGLCYPPQTWAIHVEWPRGIAGDQPAAAAAAREAQPAATSAPSKGGFDIRAVLGGGGAKSDANFLRPDKAFVLSSRSTARDRVELRWDIADEYYLYRDKVSVRANASNVQLGQPSIPGGETKHDEYFGEQVVFHDHMVAQVPVVAAAGVTEVPLEVTYQGCAEGGLCYPPIRKTVQVKLAGTGSVAPSSMSGKFRSEQDTLADMILGDNLWATLAKFFGLGLLLALTPCVWPMVPILSGIIVGAGSGQPVARGRAFSLSLAYVLGMAFTYTVAGIGFALAGKQAQAFFQKPWMIVLFAALFVWLALGMFGLFTLQLPAVLQTRLSDLSNRQKAGSLSGTAIMGALSSLIVTACVAPPLIAALAVVSQRGDVLSGGLALLSLSLGMGAPLLVIGTSAGELLPRAGPWMDTVKQFFGVMMLGVAVWMLSRVLPGPVILGLWSALAFLTGFWLFSLPSSRTRAPSPSAAGLVRRGVGVLAMVYGVAMLFGALAGRSDPLRPLAGVITAGPAESLATGDETRVVFRRIKSAADLDREVAAANAAGRTVLLDFYADWCVSCKEMEKYTFPQSAVRQALHDTVLLQADVTANDEIDQALMQRFGILGPPSILFFDRSGHELPDFRVVGFKQAADFAVHVKHAFGPGTS